MRISALFCLTFLIFPFADRARADEKPPLNPLLLREILWKEGERLNCYFTMELLASADGSYEELSTKHMKPVSPDSVKSLVTALQEQIPQAIFIIRKSQSPVVHILDKQPLKVEGYPLDQVINLSFKGTPAELTGELEKHLPNKKLNRGGAIGSVFNDYDTPVELEDAEGKAREIMTQAVPLKGYSHILWRAKTQPSTDGKWWIQLMYYVPREVEGETE